MSAFFVTAYDSYVERSSVIENPYDRTYIKQNIFGIHQEMHPKIGDTYIIESDIYEIRTKTHNYRKERNYEIFSVKKIYEYV